MGDGYGTVVGMRLAFRLLLFAVFVAACVFLVDGLSKWRHVRRAHAQTVPGTITETKTNTLTMVAGGIRCVASTANSGASVSAYCYTGSLLVFNSSAILTTAPTTKLSAVNVSYGLNQDSILGLFWRPDPAGPVNWEWVANGTYKDGVY